MGNDYIPVGTYTIVEISIHVPSWETTIFTRRQPPCILFQSTFPRGERLPPLWLLPLDSRHFNPRSLVGNDSCLQIYWEAVFYFNPRSLVGNDKVSFIVYSVDGISIHVPSWGTTAESLIWPLCILFQSTFPRGERHTVIDTYKRFKDFNPRSLVGNDPGPLRFVLQTGISIHVPSWGTTANFHKYSLFFYAINIIFLLFIIPSLFSLVLFMLLFWFL